MHTQGKPRIFLRPLYRTAELGEDARMNILQSVYRVIASKSARVEEDGGLSLHTLAKWTKNGAAS